MQNANYAADFEATLALGQERNIAVQTIKSSRAGPGRTAERNHTTWYQPLEEQDDIRVAVHWVLAQPGHVPQHGGDVHCCRRVLEAAAGLGEAVPAEAVMGRFAERAGLASIFGI